MRVSPAVFAVPFMAAQALASGNSLVNPSFEAGLDGWTTDHAGIRKGDPAPHCGANYLFGGAAAAAYSYQNIAIESLGYDEDTVDSGQAVVDYGGWQAGWGTQKDQGKIELIFLDSGGAEIFRTDLGWFYSNKVWTLLLGTVTLPQGTRTVTFGFYAQRFEGTNNDGYLDDAFLQPSDAGGCYPDFMRDGALDLFDFLAFVNAFNAGDDLANCNRDCALDLFDFLCFTNGFNAGC